MAYTLDDIRRLERAIASGAKRVEYRDKKVEYHSLPQMREALAAMRKQVNGVADKRQAGGIGTYNPTHSKGL